jgi:hypothetical protein
MRKEPIVAAISGDTEKAREYGKGMARATAGTLAISRSIPILHEITVASDSLGDVMAGANLKKLPNIGIIMQQTVWLAPFLIQFIKK